MPKFRFVETCTSLPTSEVEAPDLETALAAYLAGKGQVVEEPVIDNRLMNIFCDNELVPTDRWPDTIPSWGQPCREKHPNRHDLIERYAQRRADIAEYDADNSTSAFEEYQSLAREIARRLSYAELVTAVVAMETGKAP